MVVQTPQAGNREPVVFPSRSQLHHLEPREIGTPWVESLTGYIARLAQSHAIRPKPLLIHALWPAPGKEGKTRHYYTSLGQFWHRQAVLLNGTGSTAQEWVQRVESLTGWNTIRCLTLVIWSQVLPQAGVLRKSRAWCPVCYEEWKAANQVIYEPLLWAIQGVALCLRHHRLLQTRCPYEECSAFLPVLSQISRPGYCSRCDRWLGNWHGATAVSEEPFTLAQRQWLYWVAQGMGELLAATPNLAETPQKEHVASMVSQCVEVFGNGNMKALERTTGVLRVQISKYLRQKTLPELDTLLHLGYPFQLAPLELLAGKTIPAAKLPPLQTSQLHRSERAKISRVTSEDLAHMRWSLEQVLGGTEDPMLTKKEIAKRIGYDGQTLRKYYPELWAAIGVSTAQWGVPRETMLSRIRLALEAALAGKEPILFAAIARRLHCYPATIRRHFPELSQECVVRNRERVDLTRIQERLLAAAANEAEYPSVEELARELGHPPALLRQHCLSLCRQISAKYRAYRRRIYQEKSRQACEEICRAVVTLDQQGIYPSAAKVGQLIHNPGDVIWGLEGRAVWQAMLHDLGWKH